MIYIADGTGPYTESGYAVEMAGSNCQIINHLNKGSARYWRGPTPFDIWTRTAQIASEVFQDVMKKEFPAAFLAPGAVQAPSTPIYLVGYSRGGAAMVMVAKMLEKKRKDGIPVAGLFLFDAVAKTTTFDNLDTVPGNVQKCYHAVRNEGAQVVMELEERQLWKKCQQAAGFKEVEREFAAIGSGLFEDFLVLRSARYPELNSVAMLWKVKSKTLRNFKVAMRNSFNVGSAGLSADFENCARKHAGVKEWELNEFAGSHGALGGVPATDKGDEIRAIDRAASLGAWTWMASKMRQCGIRAGRL